MSFELDGWSLLAGGAAVASILAAIVIPTLRWVVARAIDQHVNGKVDRVAATLDQIGRRLDRHDRRHTHEQRQLIAALDRQGLTPPDGWHLDAGGS